MNTLNASITSALKNDADLVTLGVTGVYKDSAPQSTPTAPVTPPYIVYGRQGGTWDTAMDGGVVRDARYFVKAVDKSNSSVRAGNIDARVAAVLHTERFDGGARDYRAFRTGDMPDYREVADGVTYQHVGGIYRFTIA